MPTTDSDPRYRDAQEIYRSQQTVVQRAYRRADGAPVILKTVAPLSQDHSARRRLSHEYELLRSLELPGVVRTGGLHTTPAGLTLELQDIGGADLTSLCDGALPLAEFLTIAGRLASAVAALHSAGIMHRDLDPANVVYNRATGALVIVDLGLATRLAREARDPGASGRLEGTLGYLSPEQTGRMARPIDRRSDLYSLGATFYALLCGRPPHTGDALEIIHGTIAQLPEPPIRRRPSVPQPVSDVVLKLLSKQAEERYQSASGLSADLARCAQELAAFPLGLADLKTDFEIPERLYGRETAIQALIEAADRAQTGAPVAVGISGPAGSGKTALVRELEQTLAGRGGYLAAGKFEQLRRTVPYSAVIQAATSLIRAQLAERQDRLDDLRQHLRAAVGATGALVCELIPEAALVLGEQPPVPQLPPAEAAHRFHATIHAFIRALQRPAAPVVLFLDDLQWADAASLELIERLLADRSGAAPLLVLTWRSEEPPPALESLIRIELGPLGQDALGAMLRDTLRRTESDVAPLASLLLAKTAGNAFFARQFLGALYAQGLIRFESNQWTWRIEEIEAAAVTANVAELLVSQLDALPPASRRLMGIGACLGAELIVSVLSPVAESTDVETARALAPCVEAGLLVPVGDAWSIVQELAASPSDEPDQRDRDAVFRFAHDRIKQAAYAALSPDAQLHTHLAIGRQLRAHVDEDLFGAVDQLNRGRELIDDTGERRTVGELNVRAGRRARSAAAFDAALDYFEIASALLGEQVWEDDRVAAFAFHLDAAAAALMCPQRSSAGHFLESAVRHATTLAERVAAREMAIRGHLIRYENQVAIRQTVEALSWLGIKIPEKPSTAHVLLTLAKVKWKLRRLSDDDLRALPLSTNEDAQAAMRLMMDCCTAAYYTSPTLLPVVLLRMVELSLDHGLSGLSAFGFIGYAFVMVVAINDVKSATRYGAFARELLGRFDAGVRCKVDVIYYGFIDGRVSPWRDSIESFRAAAVAGTEAGDPEWTAFATDALALHHFFGGTDLDALNRIYATQVATLERLGHERTTTAGSLMWQVVESLRGNCKDPSRIQGDHFDPDERLPRLRVVGDKTNEGFFNLYGTMLRYLFASPAEAVAGADATDRFEAGFAGAIQIPLFKLYSALARIALARETKGQARSLIQKARRNLALIRKWARDCPDNCLHYQRLVEAELAAFRGDTTEAARLYDESIRLARLAGATHETALALERAGRFYLAQGRDRSAFAYLAEARGEWAQWGCTPKVAQLDALDLGLRKLALPERGSSRDPSTTSDGVGLDAASVLKAARAISSTLEVDTLLRRLMEVIIENAGADRGLLALDRDGTLHVAARASLLAAGVEVQVLDPAPAAAEPVISYVARTRERVVLDGVTRDARFSLPTPRSVLCVPIEQGPKLIGVIYLENQLATGAFTADRHEVIGALAAQAAISLQNAGLFRDLAEASRRLEEYSHTLEAQVRERTEAAEKAQRSAEAANQAKSTFLANMSHEVRTPLNAIIGLTNLAIESDPDPRTTEYLRKVRSSSRVLLGIINDILDFSRIEAGKMSLESVEFDLREIVESLSDVVGDEAHRKGLELLLSFGAGVPDTFRGDPLRLGQVLTNLVFNAVKFTQQGTIVVRVERQGSGPDARLRFAVQDTGIGIASEQIPLIFLSFTQLDGSTTRRYGGAGLGLTISQHLVELMGGKIEVTSQRGKGSTFSFSLSLHGRSDRVGSPWLANGHRGERVLVVDDNAMARDLFVDMLSTFGLEATAVDSGEAALQRLVEATEQYALVLLDWKMPGLDGLETARRIAEKGLRPRLVLATAHDHPRVRTMAEQAGIWRVIEKPVSRSALFDTVMEAFGAAERQTRHGPAATGAADARPRGARILVVEDAEVNQQVAREILERAGFVVQLASDGQEAVRLVHEQPFDAVLMDLQMPVMDGFEATRAIRSEARFGKLPIIAMTAHAMMGDRERCLEAGMNDHVPKPINVRTLMSVLSHHIARERMPEAPPLPAPVSTRTLPGIDLAGAIAQFGDERAVGSLLQKFAQRHRTAAKELSDIARDGDLEGAGKLVHTLIGVTGNLRLTETHARALALRDALHAQPPTDLAPALAALTTALDEALATIDRFAVEASPPASPGGSSTAPIREALGALDGHLARNSFDARTVWESVRAQLEGDALKPHLTRMAEAIDALDFPNARTALAELQAALEERG